jgi:hypothetical protein
MCFFVPSRLAQIVSILPISYFGTVHQSIMLSQKLLKSQQTIEKLSKELDTALQRNRDLSQELSKVVVQTRGRVMTNGRNCTP